MSSTTDGMSSLAQEDTFEGLTWPDYLVIVAYFGFVLAVGLFVSCQFANLFAWKVNFSERQTYFTSNFSVVMEKFAGQPGGILPLLAEHAFHPGEIFLNFRLWSWPGGHSNEKTF